MKTWIDFEDLSNFRSGRWTHSLYRVLVCVILQKIARCFIRYISKPLQKRQKRKTSKTSKKRKKYLVRTGSPAIHLNFTHAIKASIPWAKTSQRHRKTEKKNAWATSTQLQLNVSHFGSCFPAQFLLQTFVKCFGYSMPSFTDLGDCF